QAGLIKDQKFTLHWENQPGFIERFPRLTPSANTFEVSGPLMTCGGGNAATDLMLSLIEARHGKQLAIIVADMCLHARSGGQAAPQKSNFAVAIGSRNQRLLNALQLMQEAIEEPLQIGDLCARLDISRRQLERLFARYLNQSPMHVYCDMRLSHAFALMNETSMSVTEIALASGFNSTTHFSRQFKRKFGASPHFFRKGWS
ncbi:MAG: helix-turn-helix domain-containing protein, partial [Pseudomonadota bacterium]|nr:helix-turn-helix domain-containing protein [Pseudomonadota bacterium]